MAKKIKRIKCVMLVLVFFLTVFSGCKKSSEKQVVVDIGNLKYKNVLGVNTDEIVAIELLKRKYDSFTCAINVNTDSFIDINGEVSGFAILFYDWLSRFFGITFKPVLYEWNDYMSGIASGDIDFTIDLTDTPERRKVFFMTRPITTRHIKIYSIAGSEPITNIINWRKPRYAFTSGTTTYVDIAAEAGYEFETIFVDSHADAYPLLKSGQIDGYLALDTAEAAFDKFSGVVSYEFFPLVLRSSGLLTRNEEFKPIISVMEKALNENTLNYLIDMRNTGYQKYLQNKMYTLLTEEERSYIKNSPIVPFVAEFDNYPISFFDNKLNQWQGIYFDMLDKIADMTGLKFECVNKPDANLPELIIKLKKGEALIASELFHLKEHEGNFLWSEIPILNDNFAFITKAGFHDIDISEISYLHVGGRKNTPYSDLFLKMFPNHDNYTLYDTQETTWEALKRGEVDVIFTSKRRLVIFTNFYEDSGFKLNIIFDNKFTSSLGFNKDAAVLRSIIDKALYLIKIDTISTQWMSRTYDYRAKMSEAQRPLFFSLFALLIITLSFVSIFLHRSRNIGKRLENMVKQKTTALAFETAKLKAVIDSIPDSLFCKDKDLRYTQCNKAFEEFLSLNESDIKGAVTKDIALLSSNEDKMTYDTEQIVINEDRTITYEQRILVPSTGKILFFETVKTPLKQDGVVKGLVTIMRDISQRKEMEKEIAYNTSMLKTMIDSLPDIIFCKDLDFRYTLCNNYMADIFGKRVEDVIGKDDTNALNLSPKTAALANEADWIVIKEERRITIEEWLPCADGVMRLYETVKSPLILYGEVIGVIGVGRDITQRKVMEEELALKSSKLQMILDTIPDILFSKDLNHRYTQCNKPFEKFWGVKEAAMLDLTDTDVTWFPPDLVENMHKTELSVMEGNKMNISEMTILAPLTGKESIFESTLAPLKHNGSIVGIMCIARDITQHKTMEEEIKAASRAKTSFLANMSHEIRTPLNVVIGLTNLLLEDESLDSYVSTNLLKISNSGGTLLNIVNDILDFSKIESGKLTLTPVEYYTPSLLNDIITLVVTRLGEKPIKFYLDVRDDIPANLYGDDLRVKQIFTNMLTNAVKYTRQGSIELRVRCDLDGDNVWMDVTVSDTGIGIKEEDLNKLFSDYNQVDTKANRNIEGTGLGLSITKRLLMMMDGEIKVESEYGKGTTFHLRFKQGFVNKIPIGADIAGKLRNFCYAENKRLITKRLIRINLNYARVLVVDDMQTNLDVAVGLLRGYKMQVDCLDNGQDAIERIRKGTPAYNAIFMDHMMPGMDGIETTEAIRALGTDYAQKIPIIALTANAIYGTEQMFYEHGFQAFISKPIDVTEMDAVIKKWIRDDTKENAPISDGFSPSDVLSNGNMEIDIPGVDTKKGLSLYVGDTKVYLPLLRSYAANTPGVLDKLRNVSAETLSGYIISVHGLKGTSASIGAESIREAAMKLETMSRAGDLKGVLSQNENLIADTEIIVANIKAWLEQYNANGEKKPRLKAPDKELLARLRQSCESYDVDDIDKAMSELESADYEEGAELVTWLRQKIDISKIGEAARRLAEELSK